MSFTGGTSSCRTSPEENGCVTLYPLLLLLQCPVSFRQNIAAHITAYYNINILETLTEHHILLISAQKAHSESICENVIWCYTEWKKRTQEVPAKLTPYQNHSQNCCICQLYDKVITYAVETIDGNSLEGSSHHGIFLQHLIEVVDGQRIESTVSLRSHTGCAPTPRQ